MPAASPPVAQPYGSPQVFGDAYLRDPDPRPSQYRQRRRPVSGGLISLIVIFVGLIGVVAVLGLTGVIRIPGLALSGGQAEAREKLKAGLERWAFGDSSNRFYQEHPDIGLYVHPILEGAFALQSYEITSGRERPSKDVPGPIYEFTVLLKLQGILGNDRGRLFEKNLVFSVHRANDGKWHIVGQQPGG